MTKADQSQEWRTARTAILNAVDIAGEFEALGVRFTKSKPTAKGWRECTATFRDEQHPSAAVNVGEGPARGRYKDLGGDGRTISLFDFAVRASRAPDYKTALKAYAQKAGVKLPDADEKLFTDQLDFSDPSLGMLMLYTKGKPGVTSQAMLAVGVKYARYPKTFPVDKSQHLFMVPMYGLALLDSDPVGWHGCPANPKVPFRLWKGKGIEPELKKVWNASGSDTGIMGLDTLRQLPETEVIFWCEGLSDLWACQSAIIADGMKGVGCLGLPGANCHLDPAVVQHFAGKKHIIVYDVGDADNAGQNGAAVLATTLLPGAASVRNVQLPLGADGKKRDLRDWLCEGHTLQDLLRLAKVQAPIDPAHPPAAPMVSETREFVPFPTEILPEAMASFVRDAAKAMNCDESYVALPLLSVLASTVGNSRRVQIKRSWCEPCVIWTSIVGESGTMKSPALDAALAALRKHQDAAWRAHDVAMKAFKRDRLIYDVDIAAWKKKRHKSGQSIEPPPEEPVAPVCVRYIAEDTTVEALALLLHHQPRGLLVARDELSGWLNSFDAYKSARSADAAQWLSMHRAGSIQHDRKTGFQTIRAPRAAVSICGGVQPETLKTALAGRNASRGADDAAGSSPKEHFANGMAARLLLSMPPRLPKTWTDAEVDDITMSNMERLVENLLDLQMSVDESGEMCPIDLALTPTAKRSFIDFFNAHSKEQVELTGDLAAAWSKLEGYAARFALLFHLVRVVSGDQSVTNAALVDAVSMENGIELARWFGEEAARVYDELGGESDTPEAHEARELQRLADWIRHKGRGVTAREVQQGNRRYCTADDAEAALEALVKARRGTWDPIPTTSKGGRPTRVFRLPTPSTSTEHPITVENEGSVDTEPPKCEENGGCVDVDSVCVTANGAGEMEEGEL